MRSLHIWYNFGTSRRPATLALKCLSNLYPDSPSLHRPPLETLLSIGRYWISDVSSLLLTVTYDDPVKVPLAQNNVHGSDLPMLTPTS